MNYPDETHMCSLAGAAYRAHRRTQSRTYDPDCSITQRMEQTHSLVELRDIVSAKLGVPCHLVTLSYLSLAKGDESVRALAEGMHVSRYCVTKHERDIRGTLIPMLHAFANDVQRAPHAHE